MWCSSQRFVAARFGSTPSMVKETSPEELLLSAGERTLTPGTSRSARPRYAARSRLRRSISLTPIVSMNLMHSNMPARSAALLEVSRNLSMEEMSGSKTVGVVAGTGRPARHLYRLQLGDPVLAYVQRARPVGAEKPLLAGERIEVAAYVLDVHLYVARRLSSVQEHEDAPAPGQTRYLLHRHPKAARILDMAEEQHPGALREGPLDLVKDNFHGSSVAMGSTLTVTPWRCRESSWS